MLQHGKVQVGEFNLSVAADRLPPAYSQLSSDVPLPNLKWIDGHKSVFKVNVSMVSSIHPKVRECEEGRRERGEEGEGGRGGGEEGRERGGEERRGGRRREKENSCCSLVMHSILSVPLSHQDEHLLEFMSQYYSLHSQLGSQEEERALAVSISHLSEANPEPLVQFLHITLNSLASLLIRPTVTEESGQHIVYPV